MIIISKILIVVCLSFDRLLNMFRLMLAHRETIRNIYFLKTKHDKNILKNAFNQVKNTLSFGNFWWASLNFYEWVKSKTLTTLTKNLQNF